MVELPRVDVSRLGGDVAVDFFNTVDWRLDPERQSERLTSYLHVVAWMKSCDLVTESEASTLAELALHSPEGAADEYDVLIGLRDDTYEALNSGCTPLVLQQRLPAARAESQLVRQANGTWAWIQTEVTVRTPGHRLARELERLLTSDSVARFHRCQDRDCGWVFIDTSRQHNRRWCSAADCGNRNRVRAHLSRTRNELGAS